MGLLVFFPVVVCVAMAAIILLQSGRKAGLTESFSSAESIFGSKTNVFMIKTTTVLASCFLVTCLSLAIVSSQKEKSLMLGKKNISRQSKPEDTPTPIEPKDNPAVNVVQNSTVPEK